MKYGFRNLWSGWRITPALTLAMTSVILLAIVLLTVLDVQRERSIYLDELEETGQLVGRTLADVFADALYFRNIEQLRALSEVLRTEARIRTFEIFTPDGRLLVGSERTKYPMGRVEGPEISAALERQEPTIIEKATGVEIVSPIRVGSELLGGARFVLDMTRLEDQINAIVTEHIWQGLIILLLGIGLSYSLARSLTTPVRHLIEATGRIAAGERSVPKGRSRKDELGDLADAFEQMVSDLRESERRKADERNHSLRKLNEKLEKEIGQKLKAETEIRRLYQDLEVRVKERTSELADANKELEAFAYSVSHDLRGPLRHIAGYVHLLEDLDGEKLGVEGRSHLRTISQSALRMNDLIDGLLDFSRNGRVSLNRREIDLNALVQSAKAEAERGTEDRRISWKIGTFPPVVADQRLLSVVLVNLISNALKFTSEKPEAHVEIGCHPDSDDKVTVFVRDNGAGFDSAYRDKLFGVFERLHPSSRFEGTGIGLANVKRIVERHNGEVWAEGTEEVGATFHFTLPRSPVSEVQ